MDLLELFGGSSEDVWKIFAQELGGTYQPAEFLVSNKRVTVKFKQWTMTLDTFTRSSGKHSHVYTRFRAPFENKDGFRFKAYKKSLFSDIGKTFGMQDIEVGEPFFDDNYIIQGNDESKVKRFFGHEKVREHIMAQPSILFMVKGDDGWFSDRYPEGVDELYFECRHVIRDLNSLRHLYMLFSEALHVLCHMDSGYEVDEYL